ncbi:MAG TPA: TldD/PmbA family protein [Gemmatimonadales bacterium]|nr:TldD/PmbA family protein [Gemmatimonadales bacterium]
MIETVLARLSRRAQAGDVLFRRVEQTGVSFEAGRLKAAGASEETGVNLRVVRDGRIGVAGTTALAPENLDTLVARALASAELGEPLALDFPPPLPLPDVPTHAPGAEAAPLDRLVGIGRELVERLAREGCQVNVSVGRSVGETAVGNTAGAAAAYHFTGVSVGAEVTRIGGDDVLMVYDSWSGTDLPTAADLDALWSSVAARLDLALRVVEPPEGALPVVFTPAGLAAILLPLEQALSGKAVLQGISPLARRVGEAVFDRRFSLADDPLVPGRPDSRPVDDEGVPSRRVTLVEAGVVRGFVYDLETAARAGTRSTGHGHRGVFGKPGVGYTNLIVGEEAAGQREPGQAPRLGGGLLEGMDEGLVVDDLIGVGQGNVIGGAFSQPVGLAYRVQRGEITGRVKDAAVSGNVYELLRRIGGFGTDGRWQGSRWAPSLLLEGVSVARR